jgi:murein DD-endopeptidase MepM/ murein hydrolase activator NlpD
MMNRTLLLIILLFANCVSVFPQLPNYPQGYFRWPVNLKPEIVANLGELRPNHWHMGLDIRTNAQVNQLVYAAADGYIAKVGIKPQGFGRHIVINHPNGLSTLYAHLNNFAPELEKYVTEQQYQQQSWSLDLEIPADKFPVKKGDFISYSGTTGGSQGPHVHFEIRDTKTDECLNPLLFGFPLQDNVKPVIQKLAIYDRTKSTYIATPQMLGLQKNEQGYRLLKQEKIKTTFSKLSFAIQAYDQLSGSSNQDGIYCAEIFLDDKPICSFKMDKISYDETAYINAHVDYPLKYNGGGYLQHLSLLPGNNQNVYAGSASNGIIELSDTLVHSVSIKVEDAYNNVSVLNFTIQLDDTTAKPQKTTTVDNFFIPGNINLLEKPDFELYLPEIALYDSVPSFYYRTASSVPYAVSAIHQASDASIPVHDNLQVRINPDRIIPEEWKHKLLIQRTYRNSRSIQKAEWQGEWLQANFGGFGNFQAFADAVPPILNELGKGDTINLSAASRIAITPTDNFGIKSFRAELDGQWLRFTNDKSRTWIYTFDERCPDGVHKLKVTVEDLVGNITSKTWWFKKYPYIAPPKKATTKKTSTTKKKTVKKK